MSNFIVLLSDEHNPRYCGPYGHASVQTPHMDALAQRGVVYENAYCPSPLCLPSRAAFLTGKRVHEIQTYSNCNLLLDPTVPSFGAALAERDVYTVYIGKTDVHAPGKELGFNEMIRPVDRKPPGDYNHGRNPMSIRKNSANRANGFGSKVDAGTDDMTCVDEAVNWLQNSATKMTRPWVLIVNVLNPHFPHMAAPEFWDKYPDGDLPEYGVECESARHPYAAAIRKHFETDAFSDEQVRGLRRGYLACISFVDQQLGRLKAAMDDRGLNDTTNLVYTSDHGEMLGKFGMWWKCSLYEDAVRIPMIAAGPDFAKGKRVSTPVDLHDLQASFFHASAAEQPVGILGEPLQQLADADSERVVFSEYHGHGAPGSSYMIRQGDWKYIHYSGAASQLFNLVNDPEELVNIAELETDIVSSMEASLRKICSPEIENERAEKMIEDQLEAYSATKDS